MADRNVLPWRDTRARTGGTHGKLVRDGSSFVKINWDSGQERSSGHLTTDDLQANELHAVVADILRDPELDDDDRREFAKIERETMDTLLADRRSWCPSCINVLTNCTCPIPPHL